MDKILAGILVLLVIVFFSFIGAWPTLWLVNYLFTSTLLVNVFGVPALTFWKALWLNVLIGGLFRSSSK